jgi:hypothetical protein
MLAKSILSITILVCAAAAPLAGADARQAPSKSGGKERIIKACSKYGSQCVTARVRETRLGPQYLSPGGNWIWCEYGCRETLRRHTVDFWEDLRERSR